MSSEETVGQQQPPERPATRTSDEAIAEERDRARDRLSSVTLTPGARKTRTVDVLVIEAELVAEGKVLDNPARPVDVETGEAFQERIEDTDLVPAWTRPWEVDGDE